MPARHCSRRAAEAERGADCRAFEGLCACTCGDCTEARGCPHAHTYGSLWTLTPLFGDMRMKFGVGRAKRSDGTDYVGPTMTLVPPRPGEPPARTESGTSETCLDCGMRIRGRSTLTPRSR